MKAIESISAYLFLMLFFAISLFPFYWMFVISSHTTSAVNHFPPLFTPGHLFGDNFSKVIKEIDFFKALWNTAAASGIATILQLVFCSLAAFAFSYITFKGSKLLYVFIISTMMIPSQLGLVPSYFIMTTFGWINSLKAIIVPGLVSAYGVFWLKQYMEAAVHPHMLESAKIDGCSHFQTYYRIVVPIILPALAALAILTFMGIWNEFVWASLVLKSSDSQTIQIALRNLSKVYYKDYAMIMAGTFAATIPLLLILAAFGRFFITGITAGAVKG
ncbi:carbohydrate ABC transporter permease [Cohnella sp.]|uniref:carbohydrate ABC transporter permease n=1 Tax=Cohnella sp. TaxID=1883426 RepID=UPI00356798D4